MDRILVVGPAKPALGGIASYVDELIESSLKNKYEFYVLNTYLVKQRNVKYGESRFRIKCILETFILIFIFIKTIILLKPKIIHIPTSSFWGYYEKSLLAIIAKVLGFKTILHIQGGAFKIFYNKSYFKILIKFLLRVPDRIIVLSDGWYRWFVKIVPENKLHIIPNAVSLYEFSEAKKNEYYKFLFLGRIVKQKGIFEIIQAVDLLRKNINTPFKILIVGDGPNFVELVKQVKEREMDNVIKLTGYVDNQQKQKILYMCDYFLLPSYAEGLPIALLESMAAGHYVIATDVGAIPDIIINEERGILIKPRSSENLYKAMKQVMLNTSKYKLLGRENRKVIKENYSWDVVVEKIESLYKELY